MVADHPSACLQVEHAEAVSHDNEALRTELDMVRAESAPDIIQHL